LADKKIKESVINTMRLEKYIATSGIASRRAVKKSILAGAVTVNGEPVLVPGHPIDIETDSIEFEGKQVEPLTEHIYLMLNKPADCITTRNDERGRPTVMDLVADLSDTIYPVGRLDLETEGLLLFTNDGDFAYRLLHPSHEIEKTYLAWVRGVPRDDAIQRLRRGVTIPSGKTAPAKVRRLKVSRGGESIKFEVTIHEGKKRQVRMMFKAMGHPVIRLRRTRIGTLKLGNLTSGAYRLLTSEEVSKLLML
jgi:pseudouridine synthase